jgi:hypothetical protein
MGQKLLEIGAVRLAIGVEEALFQGMEVLLELCRGHGVLMDAPLSGRVSTKFFSACGVYVFWGFWGNWVGRGGFFVDRVWWIGWVRRFVVG